MSFRNAAVAGLVFTSSVLALPTTEYSHKEVQPQKRGIRAPAHRHELPIQKRAEGAVEANNDGGGWVLPVLIGGQQLFLNIDTGSSDLWTSSTLMPSSQQDTVTCNTIYDPSNSTDFQYVDGYTFNITYVDGSGASGPVGTDIVNLGGAEVNMPFGLCNDLRYGGGGSGHRDTDGPVGLGFRAGNSIRPEPQCTFMECLVPYVPESVFATNFKTDSSGAVDFGFVDTSLYTGQLTTIPIDNSSSQWEADNVRYGSGGQIFSGDPVSTDFDTGFAGLTIPSAAYEAYFSLVPSAQKDSSGSYYYNCDDSLPDFDFIFGSVIDGPQTVTIPGSNLVNTASTSNGFCYTWIGALTDGGYINAGMPFYISEYMIFNLTGPTLSFGRQAPTPSTTSWGYLPSYDEESGTFYA